MTMPFLQNMIVIFTTIHLQQNIRFVLSQPADDVQNFRRNKNQNLWMKEIHPWLQRHRYQVQCFLAKVVLAWTRKCSNPATVQMMAARPSVDTTARACLMPVSTLSRTGLMIRVKVVLADNMVWPGVLPVFTADSGQTGPVNTQFIELFLWYQQSAINTWTHLQLSWELDWLVTWSPMELMILTHSNKSTKTCKR